MKRFALIGAAGYIAPRHMKAIKEVGGNLVSAMDVNDSVGILDSYFPDAQFFTDFEQFGEHIDAERRLGCDLNYVAIASPNYLHYDHIKFALLANADAICEKPLVLNLEDIDVLEDIERNTGRNIKTILQLRLHPAIIALRDRVARLPKNKKVDVDLTYITSRGNWYLKSWKAVDEKSGGIATNIGVHFFDMLGYVFGPISENITHHRDLDVAAGYLELQRARVRWMLSINRDHLPDHTPELQTTHRSIRVEGQEIEFSGGFTDLHTTSYKKILDGNGYGLDDVRPSIEIVSDIRNAQLQPQRGEQHPSLAKVLG